MYKIWITGIEQKFGCITGLLVLSVLLAVTQSVHAQQRETDTLRVGVILLQGNDEASLAAEAEAVLLLPELHAEAVERTEFDRVLDEQALSLSAMSDPNSALALGKALRADALLILEPNEQFLQARVMDTVHGVVIAESLVQKRKPDAFMPTLRSTLARALEKVRVSAEDMVYVSVMGVSAAADIDQLKPVASQLGPLIRADLQAIPRVRIVEREQLAQIQRENQLAGGGGAAVGAAVVIEGELRPVDDGKRVALSIIVSEPGKEESITLDSGATDIDIKALRAISSEHIRKHMKMVESTEAVQAGPDEAAAILARTYWRVMHQDYKDAEGRTEAALLIDGSLDKLDQAWWIYYQLGVSGIYVEPPLEAERAIHAIRRHHEIKFAITRDPSKRREFRNTSRLNPIHYDVAYTMARTEADWREIDRIDRVTDQWFELAAIDRRERGESIVPLLRFRLETLPWSARTPEAYIEQAKALIQRIRQESVPDDWFGGDPAVMPFHEHMMQWWNYVHHPEAVGIKYGSKEIQPLFEWMLTQDDSGLRILAYWYKMSCGPEDEQAAAADMLLRLLFETKGFHNPGYDEVGLSINGYYPQLADEATLLLYNRRALGGWFDGFLDRVEKTRSIDPLLNWYSRDLTQMIETGDDEQMHARRFNRTVRLLDQIECQEDRLSDKKYLLEALAKLQSKFDDIAAHRNDTNPWGLYDAKPIEVEGMTDEMLRPDTYYLAGGDGDKDRALYIAWATRERHVWVFTRCALSGGKLTEIGRGKLVPLGVFYEPSFQMAVCGEHLIVGGVDGLLVFSERDGTSSKFGPEQGLPGAFVRSLAVMGDRVLLGSDNGLSLFNPEAGTLVPLTNALAAEAKTPLDRVPPYHVENLLPVEEFNRCLFTVLGNFAVGSQGIWQYDFKTQIVKRVQDSKSVFNTWRFRGDIVGIRSFEHGFLRYDPQVDAFVVYDDFPYDIEPWYYLLKSNSTPIIVRDHLIARDSYILDTEGRTYMRFDHDIEWKYGAVLDSNSVFLGYPFMLKNARQPAMWIMTRR